LSSGGVSATVELEGAALLPRRPQIQVILILTCVAVVAAMFGLGGWSYASMRDFLLGPSSMQHPCPIHTERHE